MLQMKRGSAFVTAVLFAVVVVTNGKRVGLYEDTDLMDILDKNNFNETILQSNTSYVVEFYNSYCGHCIRFSGPWKEFGLEVYGWRKYAKVGVIDCSDEINSQICREYEIMGYPCVRYFPPYPEPTDIGIEFDRSFDIQVMKRALVKKLTETQRNGNFSSLCDLQPYLNTTLVSNSDYVLTYVMVDDIEKMSELGRELIIDFCPEKKIKITYVLNSNTKIMELFDVKTFPSLFLVKNNEFKLKASGNNKTSYIEIINADLKEAHLNPLSLFEITTKLYNMLFTNDKLSIDANTVYLSDLEATLRYSLDHEVTSRSIISEESLSSLITYLEFLSECFPSNVRGKKLLSLILDSIRNNQTVTGEKLGDIINKYEFLINPYITKRKWIGCQGSDTMFRKYPCGLWTLFHTLTVQASIRNISSFTGEQILEAIAGYVKHFFGCTECSEHFMAMTTTIHGNVSSLDDAVLWLWSAHNQVNQRLAGDVTEDPKFPKILFPSKVNCAACRDNVTNEWNKPEVLKYLKKMYSVINIRLTPNDNQEQNIISAQQIINNDSNYNDIFDEEDWKIDVNACMVSYILSCTVLMVVFYLLVIKKRCKKNKYIYFVLSKV